MGAATCGLMVPWVVGACVTPADGTYIGKFSNKMLTSDGHALIYPCRLPKGHA